MREIALLDQQTIDQIAAGEVIERPASIVKELVENAIDAGANAVTVEVKDGGISFIRITDNGSGIEAAQVPLAFLSHATSKIRGAEDLLGVTSLGFRGEALSSIAAVCQVETITKTAESLTGTRYLIEGGQEKGREEIGAPTGTTFLVRNVFYNTPARKKFLKSPQTETGYISDLVERMALSHPEVSFKFIANGQTRLHTSGNYNLKDIIYHIYGREIAGNLIEISAGAAPVTVTGFIGKPVISRGNRNYENVFVNGRYIKSPVIAKAIEEAYHTFMMKHRYPFAVLHFAIDGELLDVNVHPAKLELRFSDSERVYRLVYDAVRAALTHREMIPQASVGKEEAPEQKMEKISVPEPFEAARRQAEQMTRTLQELQAAGPSAGRSGASGIYGANAAGAAKDRIRELPSYGREDRAEASRTELPRTVPDPREAARTKDAGQTDEGREPAGKETAREEPPSEMGSAVAEAADAVRRAKRGQLDQLELFDDRLLSRENVKEHRILGQLFDTYWLVQFRDNLFIIDQHAAHEKVMYERMKKAMKTREFTSQNLDPPIIMTLSMTEAQLLGKYMDRFTALGFDIDGFGGREYALRAVPDNLFGLADRDIFVELLDSLAGQAETMNAEMIDDKIASMSCKAAVKGNTRLSIQEVQALIDELLSLENPYNCPHGRPTIISISKYELEKKFKRIV